MLAVYTIVLFVAGYTVSTPELVGDSLRIDIFNAVTIVGHALALSAVHVVTVISDGN